MTPGTTTPGSQPGSQTGIGPVALTCGPGQDEGGAAPPRIWRLRSNQYRNTIAALLGGRPSATRPLAPLPSGVTAPFDTVNTADRFSSYSASYSMNEFDFRQAMDSGNDVAVRLVEQLKKEGTCLATGMPAYEACLRSLLADKGAVAFRRPLTKAELDHYVGIATKSQPALNADEATTLAFEALLLSPYFLFRTELGEGPANAAGLVRLSPFEVATALSYSLADMPPDEELWKAAEGKQLESATAIRGHVERLIANLGDRQSVLTFFREYLRYDHASDVFKDAKDVPFHKPELLEDDTALWIKDLLTTAGRKGLLKELLTTNTGFVRKDTATNYGVQATVKATAPAKVTLPAGERAGILTQPSVLAAFSLMDENEPVQRGRFVAESFLCQKVPDLPIGQVPKLPDVGPEFTLRDRLKLHSADPSCWACHKLMDPLGLAFEAYDHTGRYRTMIGAKSADASGELYGSGTGDGPLRGVVELAGKLAASPVVTQCFARHAFRHWMGREELAGDSCAIVAAQKAYDEAGGDFVALVSAIFGSPAFAYRNPSAAK